MEERRAGEFTTYETRGEAHEKVDKRKRYSQILECLMENGSLTAKECAVIMMQKGYVPTSERGWCAPRMTEMSQNGIIEPILEESISITTLRARAMTARFRIASD